MPREERRMLNLSPHAPVVPGERYMSVGRSHNGFFRVTRLFVNLDGLGRRPEYMHHMYGSTKSKKKGRRHSHLFYALLLRNPPPMLVIEDIRVGCNSQFANVGHGIPAALFTAVVPELTIETAPEGMDVTITFNNHDVQPIRVACSMAGVSPLG